MKNFLVLFFLICSPIVCCAQILGDGWTREEHDAYWQEIQQRDRERERAHQRFLEEQERERRATENRIRSERFVSALDVDEMIAHVLISEGFSTVDEIALVAVDELSSIEGFDEDLAQELQNRAKAFVEKRNAEFVEKTKTLGVDDSLKTISGLDQDMILSLAEHDVKNLDDLADLASDELMEILGEGIITEAEANRIIMSAREHWFTEDENN